MPHLLSLLPQLFFLAPLAYVLIRGALAALLFVAIKMQWPSQAELWTRVLIGVEGVTGLALVLGASTQVAAIIALLIFIYWIVRPTTRPYPLSTVLLAIVLAITIIVSGAGLFAIDLPL